MHHLLKVLVLMLAGLLIWLLFSNSVITAKNKISDLFGRGATKNSEEDLVTKLDSVLSKMKASAVNAANVAKNLKDDPLQRQALVDGFEIFIGENTDLIEESKQIVGQIKETTREKTSNASKTLRQISETFDTITFNTKDVKEKAEEYEDDSGNLYMCYPVE